MKAEVFYKANMELGEGIMWHKARRSFFWVDIKGKTVYECTWSDKKVFKTEFPFRVTLILETEDSDVILMGVQGGIVKYNLSSRQTNWIVDIEKQIPDNRTNDGGYDAAGRIWIGTMNVDCNKYAGAMYCLEKDGTLHKKLDRMTIPNAIAWSRDNTTMFLVESEDKVINEYDYNLQTGDIKFARVAIKVPDGLGSPDGMCMDDDEMLWVAHYSGFAVRRWNPVEAKMLDKIDVPVPNVTSCAFGGDDNKTMLITTALQELSPEELVKYPDSGSVFMVEF